MKNYSLMKFPNFLDKAVTLSYDDGTVFDKKLVFILNKFGLKCTFNLNSELFATKTGERRMTLEECTALLKNTPHEVACHGAKHLSLGEVSLEAATRDMSVDREKLEKYFGKIIKGMAYANGSYNDEVVCMLKTCGFKYGRTTVATEKFDIPSDWLKLEPTCHHGNVKLEQITEEFLSEDKRDYFWNKTNAPKLFYLWGHSYEFNDGDNWDIIEKFCKKVGNREDVYYATNAEIYDYVKAFESLEYSFDGKIIHNPSSIDIFYNNFGTNVFIGAGNTVRL